MIYVEKEEQGGSWPGSLTSVSSSRVAPVSRDLATRWASAISLYSPDKLPLSTAVSRVKHAPVEVTEVTLNFLRAKLCCSSLVTPFVHHLQKQLH